MPNVGFATMQVVPSFRGAQRTLSQGISGPATAAGVEAGGRFGGGMGSALKKVAATVGAVFVVNEARQFFSDAISGASDLNESMSKNKIVFGDASGSVLKFADNAASALGQSKAQALEATGVFGNLLRSVGLNKGKSADLSTSLTGLASDLASFNNTSVDDALVALRSGLVGETEPLKRFGVNLNEATLKQKALSMGLGDGKAPLDANAKAQAAYALIMEQTSLAQGDFARTSDGLANKQRILGAKFEDLKAKIGARLLPVVTAITAFLADDMGPILDRIGDKIGAVVKAVTPFVRSFVAGFGKLVNAFKVLTGDDGPQGFGEIMDNLLGNSGKYVDLFRSIGETILTVVGFIRDHFKPILLGLGVAFAVIVSPIGALVAALAFAYIRFQVVRDVIGVVVAFLMGTVVPAVASFVAFVAEQFSHLAEWVRLHWAGIEEAISHVVRVVQEVIGVAVDWISAIWRAWGDDLMRVVGVVWDSIRETVENAINLVRSIIETVVALINGDWGKAWDGIKGILAAVWDQIWNIVSTAMNLVGSLIGAAISSVQEIWRGAWDKIAGFVDAAWRRITGVLSGVGAFLFRNVIAPFEGVLTWFGRIPGRIATLASGMFDGIKGAFRSAVNWIIDKWNNFSLTVDIPDLIPGLPDKFVLTTPNVPRLHGGGLFSVPGGGEGLAMLLDGERVLSPSQADQFPGGGTRVVQVMLDRKVIAQAVYEDFADRAGSDGPFLSQAGAA